MTVCSDIVSDNSSSDKCGPDKCGPDKCSFDMVSDMVSDNPASDQHGSEQCAQTWSGNIVSDTWISALLNAAPISVGLTSVALTTMAPRSMALTSAAPTWSLTWCLTILALINMVPTSVLCHDLTIMAAINEFQLYWVYPGDCGSDKHGADMVSDMVFDNPTSDKHGSGKYTLAWSDNHCCDECGWQVQLRPGLWLWLSLTWCERWYWILDILVEIDISDRSNLSCYIFPMLHTGSEDIVDLHHSKQVAQVQEQKHCL